MPSIVWCDRARYIVGETPEEAEEACQSAMDEGRLFVHLKDERDNYKRNSKEFVRLKITKISAIEDR